VLDLLESELLYAKMSKCSFFQQSVHFLGHVSLLMGFMLIPGKLL